MPLETVQSRLLWGFALGLVGGAGQRSLSVMSSSSHQGAGADWGECDLHFVLPSLCVKPRTLGGTYA